MTPALIRACLPVIVGVAAVEALEALWFPTITASMSYALLLATAVGTACAGAYWGVRARSNELERMQAATFSCAEAASACETLEDMLASVHRVVIDLMPGAGFCVCLYDPGTNLLSFPFFSDGSGPPPPARPGKGLVEYVLRTARPLRASPATIQELIGRGDLDANTGAMHWLGVPLKTPERTWGVMAVQRAPAAERFHALHEQLLTVVANELGRSIERKRTDAARRYRERRAREPVEYGRDVAAFAGATATALTRSGGLPELLGLCTDAMVEHLHAALARIWTVGADQRVLELQASSGLFTHLDGRDSRVPIGQLKIGRIAEARQPYVTNTVVDDPTIGDQDWARREGMVAWAGFPLLVDNRLFGVMAMFAKEPLSDAFVRTLSSTANEIALRIQRRQAEDALRASEAKFRGLFERVLEGLYQCGRDHRLRMVNPAFAAMLGYESAAELLEVGSLEALYADPDCRADLMRQLEEKGELRNVEVSWKRRDGTTVVGLENLRTIRHDDGEWLYCEGSVTDITERKRLEAQLRQAQKMEAVGRLAGGIAHDFNNLLTGIVGLSTMLLEDIGPDHPLRVDLEEIKKAGESAAILTRQLLAFSRKQVLQPRVLNLNNIIANVEKLLRRVIGEDIELLTVLNPELDCVNADPGQVEQVIMNLAVNARDAMPDGGALTIETDNVELDALYARDHPGSVPGHYVMLAIADTGCGMDQETQSHLFEPFFTTKPVGQGTGLGLATVYGIVKQSGGYIWVSSELGKGTMVQVYLPHVLQKVEAVERPETRREARAGTETILLVEDSDEARAVARQVLERWGYRILESHNGDEALLTAAEHTGPIDLLLTDVVMPGINGQVLADKLLQLHPEARVLFTSGYTQDTIVRQGVLKPDTHFIPKPFTPRDLVEKVREVLDAAERDVPA